MGRLRTLSQARNFIHFLWMIYIFALFLFIFIAYLLTAQRAEADDVITDSAHLRFFVYIFSLLALLSFLGGFYIYKRLPFFIVKGTVRRATHESNVSGAERTSEQIATAALTYSVLVAAFLESCGIYGLILVILGADFLLILPFTLLALIGFIVFRPNRLFFEKIIYKIQDVSGNHEIATRIESYGDRASRMKVLAFMFVVLWVLIHIFLKAVALDFSTVAIDNSIINSFIMCFSILFVGFIALLFQRVGGIILIICGAAFLVVGGILFFTRDVSLRVILLIEAAWSLPLLLAGILFLESHRRGAKTGDIVTR